MRTLNIGLTAIVLLCMNAPLKAEDSISAHAFDLVMHGHFDSAQALIEGGADVEYLDYRYGKKMSEELLSHPVGAMVGMIAFPITFMDLLFGKSPTYTNSLYNAAIVNQPSAERDEFIYYLHRKGLDPNHGNTSVIIPLIAQGQDSLILDFLAWGTNSDRCGRQLLSYAIMNEDIEFLDALIEAGVRADEPNSAVAVDPLVLAFRSGDSALFEKVLDAGGNPSLPYRREESTSYSLTYELIEAKDTTFLKSLSERGLKLSSIEHHYYTSMEMAFQHEDQAYIMFLVDVGVDPYEFDMVNQSAVADIAKRKDDFSLEVLSYFLTLERPARTKQEVQEAALDAAILADNLPAIQILLNHGVPVTEDILESMYFHLENFTYESDLVPIIELVHEDKDSYSYLHGQAFLGIDQNDSVLLKKSLAKATELGIDLQPTESFRADLLYDAIDDLHPESVRILFEYGFNPTPIVEILPDRDFWWREYYSGKPDRQEKMQLILQHLHQAGAPIDSLESFWKQPIY